MTKRKIILLSSIFILLIIYIHQIIFSSKGKIKEIAPKEIPNIVLIQNSHEDIILKKDNGLWTVNNNIPSQTELSDYICKAATSIKIIDTVSKSNSEEELKKYGLDKPIKVTTKLNDKTIQTLLIGKAAQNNNQTYVKLEKKKEIYLVSGNLNSLFDITFNELQDMTLYSLNENELYKISVLHNLDESDKEEFSIEKSGEISEYNWKVESCSNDKIDLTKFNPEKFQNWITSILELKATNWLEDFEQAKEITEAKPDVKISIGAKGTDIILDLYKSEDQIICICSENEFPCYISIDDWKKLNISINDFLD